MPTAVLRFPGGRYHATPGGHHVNEGIVEWPPSPWRLMRALIACGYATQHWEEVPEVGRRLVEALSSALPEYSLPQGALAHTRHYMPLGKLDKGREKTTLVLDTFADVGDGELWVRWPTTLDEEAQQLFDVLVRNLGYLGRSESWVLGEALADDVPMPSRRRAFPHTNESRPGRGFEQVALTAPDDFGAYAGWRSQEVEAAIAELEIPVGKKLTKAQKKALDAIEALYPKDLLDCLQCDTAWWQKNKWSQAPGSRTVLYWRESNALAVGAPSAPRVSTAPPVEMVLLALTTPSGSTSALPQVARTLPQAELLHRALISKVGRGSDPCPELVGRGEDGEPLQGHRHAHLLPVDLDADGRLDHIVMYAPMGLSAVAQHAIRSVRKTYMKGGVGQLQVAIAGIGELKQLRDLPGKLGTSAGRLFDESPTWISATPFVPPRHMKKRGANTLIGQVEAELSSRGFPAVEIEVLPWNAETLAMRHFIRRRRKAAVQPPADAGFVLRLKFERPVSGPIALGYGSHFGLGMFRSEE